MFSRRPRIGHGTVIAYVALFIALGGSGYAATVIATTARGGGVKVRCSASRSGKRVSCKVVTGSGVGPAGPRGPHGAQGPPGASGTSGPTTLSNPPGYEIATGDGFPWTNTAGQSFDNQREQEFTAYPGNGTGKAYSGQTTLTTALLSPSSVAGGTEHLGSAQFCYGAYNNTNSAASGPASIAITSAAVVEQHEPSASGTTAPSSPATITTPEAPPYGSPTTLVSASFAPALSSSYACRTIQASTPPQITGDGYLSLVLTVTFSVPSWTGAYPEATLSLGRVTTTYSP